MFWYHEEIENFVRFCVIEEEEIRIAIAFESLDHGIVCSVHYLLSKHDAGFQLVILRTGAAVKIGYWEIVSIAFDALST